MRVPNFEGCTLGNDGLMMYKNRIYVPHNEESRILILSEVHRVVYMDHPGVTKMMLDINPLLF
jgi:hypothetical protein